MARAKTHVAPFDVYKNGLKEKANTKSGFRINRRKPADDEDFIWCPKGETYYTWKFRYGGTHRSRNRPRPSQLTQSEFLGRAYALGEELEDMDVDHYFANPEELETFGEEKGEEVREMGEECYDKIINMEDAGLTGGSSHEILTERVEYCEQWADALESVDGSFDPADYEVEPDAIEREDYDSDDEYDEAVQEAKTEAEDASEEAARERIEEIISEYQDCQYEGG